MSGLRQLDVRRHLADPTIKQRYVTAMFEVIAPRYDDFTRAFSFGMDAGWKRWLARAAVVDLPEAPRVLDLACGTGDLAALVADAAEGAQVDGLDASPRMIAAARRRHRGRVALRFAVGDMMALPGGRATRDLVTVGYGLRNVPDHEGALSEIARVLRPGGRLAILDFTRPTCRPWRAAYLAYLKLAGDWYGWRWHGHAAVYGYIARSIAAFLTEPQLAAAVEANGFRVALRRTALGGGIALMIAERAG